MPGPSPGRPRRSGGPVDQPGVRLLGLAAEHLDVGGQQLRRYVVGAAPRPRRAPPPGRRRSPGGPARPGPARPRRPRPPGVSARIFLYACSAASRSPLISASSASTSRGSSGWVARSTPPALSTRLDPLPQLRLGQHPGERVDRLPADDRVHHRDALDPEHLREPRVGVDVDLGQHPGAATLDGELLQHRGELLAGLAPLGPEVDHDGRGQRALQHLGLEGRLGDVDHRDPARPTGGRAPPGVGRRTRLAGDGAGCWAGVRSALRSTAPRVKIDEVIRGSLMVV